MATQHTHHWLLGATRDSVTHGVCACGAERDFVDETPALMRGALSGAERADWSARFAGAAALTLDPMRQSWTLR